jgi:hypothetical protein
MWHIGQTDGMTGESQWALSATYSKKPIREARPHEHPVQRGTYSQSVLTACSSTGLPSACGRPSFQCR